MRERIKEWVKIRENGKEIKKRKKDKNKFEWERCKELERMRLKKREEMKER